MTRETLLGSLVVDVTREDVLRGWKEILVCTRDRQKHLVRVNALPERLKMPVLLRYLASEDAVDVLRPCLAKEFASDEFLNNLPVVCLARLQNTALALCLGPEHFKAMAEKALAGVTCSKGAEPCP